MPQSRSRRDILWDRSGNPAPYVSRQLGIEERELHDAIHKIKNRSFPPGGQDRVIIYRDGSVTDEYGEEIGNIHDEI